MLIFYLNLIENQVDKNKFEQLYLKYRGLMHHVAKKILYDDYLAEDAVHEAFIRVAKNINKISEISCPQTKNYLVIIVRNVSLDMIKKGENEMTINQDAWNNYESCENLEEKILDKLEVEKIIIQINNLPASHKDVLYMNVVELMSIKEIAQLLGKKEDTIKKQIQRAKLMIIKALEQGAAI